MKTMTCRELGGTCDQKLSASSWDEMVKADCVGSRVRTSYALAEGSASEVGLVAQGGVR